MVLLTTAPDSARKVSPGAVFSEDVPAEEASARDVDVETDLTETATATATATETETGARCSGGRRDDVHDGEPQARAAVVVVAAARDPPG